MHAVDEEQRGNWRCRLEKDNSGMTAKLWADFRHGNKERKIKEKMFGKFARLG